MSGVQAYGRVAGTMDAEAHQIEGCFDLTRPQIKPNGAVAMIDLSNVNFVQSRAAQQLTFLESRWIQIGSIAWLKRVV